MRKIVLVYPPITKEERYSSKNIGAAGGEQIPLGIFYLASYVESHGYQVKVIDAEALKLDENKVIAEIDEFGAEYIGISSTTVAFHRARALAEKIKLHTPGKTIILGGVHVTSNTADAMSHRCFDYGVLSEGEETLYQLLECLESKTSPADICGISYREGDSLVITDKREYIADLDSLPFPAFHLIDDISIYTPPPNKYRTLPVINIITSRGCPNNCTFCDKSIFTKSYRERSALNIVEELKQLKDKYDFKEIAFVDDTFLVNKKRVFELFSLLNEHNIRFYWTCMSRINNVDYDFLKFLKENGCWHISFGIESGNAQILKTIKKNITLDKVRQVVAWCGELGIKSQGFFIIGHPGETVDTINETIEFALSLRFDDITVTINTPIPGSEQYRTADSYGTFDKTDWSQFSYWRPVFVPEGLTEELLMAKQKEFYVRFYKQPRHVMRHIRSFFGKGGIKRLRNIGKIIGYAFAKSS